jgi:hypothetical protein
MARGRKTSYTSKQRRQAQNIEESGRKRGMSTKRAAQMAYATVNKQEAEAEEGGRGRGKRRSTSSSRRGGRPSGRTSSRTRGRSRTRSR